jgi:hypothetical protein
MDPSIPDNVMGSTVSTFTPFLTGIVDVVGAVVGSLTDVVVGIVVGWVVAG